MKNLSKRLEELEKKYEPTDYGEECAYDKITDIKYFNKDLLALFKEAMEEVIGDDKMYIINHKITANLTKHEGVIEDAERTMDDQRIGLAKTQAYHDRGQEARQRLERMMK